MRGVYALIVKVPTHLEFRVGALGVMSFNPGYYAYVGSAQGKSTNIENRLARHFKEDKKVHWHIDYLLATKAQLTEAVFSSSVESFECELAKELVDGAQVKWGPRNFGASDCTTKCKSHLVRIEAEKDVIELVSDAFRVLNLTPKLYTQELQKTLT